MRQNEDSDLGSTLWGNSAPGASPKEAILQLRPLFCLAFVSLVSLTLYSTWKRNTTAESPSRKPDLTYFPPTKTVWLQPIAMTINCVCMQQHVSMCEYMTGTGSLHTCAQLFPHWLWWHRVMPTNFFIPFHWPGGDHSSLWEHLKTERRWAIVDPYLHIITVWVEKE